MQLLALARGYSASVSSLKKAEPLKGRIVVLKDVANDARLYKNDASSQIDSTEMTESGGSR
jgi:hypothetical protein